VRDTRGVAVTTVLIPIGLEAGMFEWDEELALRSPDRATRYPTLGELRAAARLSSPLELHEHFSDGTWYAFLSYGAVPREFGVQRCCGGGGFELSADVDRLDDEVIVTSVGFRGSHAKIDAVADAIAAAIGPVVTRRRFHGPPATA
jgi:hypothetical protein